MNQQMDPELLKLALMYMDQQSRAPGLQAEAGTAQLQNRSAELQLLQQLSAAGDNGLLSLIGKGELTDDNTRQIEEAASLDPGGPMSQRMLSMLNSPRVRDKVKGEAEGTQIVDKYLGHGIPGWAARLGLVGIPDLIDWATTDPELEKNRLSLIEMLQSQQRPQAPAQQANPFMAMLMQALMGQQAPLNDPHIGGGVQMGGLGVDFHGHQPLGDGQGYGVGGSSTPRNVPGGQPGGQAYDGPGGANAPQPRQLGQGGPKRIPGQAPGRQFGGPAQEFPFQQDQGTWAPYPGKMSDPAMQGLPGFPKPPAAAGQPQPRRELRPMAPSGATQPNLSLIDSTLGPPPPPAQQLSMGVEGLMRTLGQNHEHGGRQLDPAGAGQGVMRRDMSLMAQQLYEAAERQRALEAFMQQRMPR